MTVVNRLPFPVMQLSKSDGTPAVGWTLTFYLSGTTTLANVYTAVDLTGPTNAIVLNSYGMPDVDIFLDPDVNYKLVITDDAAATVFTYNNVRDFARRAVAHFTIYAGNPNGNVAGTAGTVGGTPADAIFDTTNGIIWICTTTGTAGTAVWTNVSSALSGAVSFTGVLTPASFSTQQDNYNPTSLSTTSTIRLNPGADSDITGIAGGSAGRVLTLVNVNATYRVTLRNENSSSTISNRFLLPGAADVILPPNYSCTLQYDSLTARWRLKDAPSGLLPAGTTAQRPASPVVGQSRYNSTTGAAEFYTAAGWASVGKAPTVQIFTSGTSATYTTPAGATYIHVRAVAGGGGGGGTGSGSPGAGGTGGTTTFNSVSAAGGAGGSPSPGGNDGAAGGAGGTGGAGTATIRVVGGSGSGGGSFGASQRSQGGAGGAAAFFGGGGGGAPGGGPTAGTNGSTNTGGGGGGASDIDTNGGGGGGAGEYYELIIGTPAATYVYSVGAAGTAGAAGTNGAAGGAGAAGRIEVWEYYN